MEISRDALLAEISSQINKCKSLSYIHAFDEGWINVQIQEALQACDVGESVNALKFITRCLNVRRQIDKKDVDRKHTFTSVIAGLLRYIHNSYGLNKKRYSDGNAKDAIMYATVCSIECMLSPPLLRAFPPGVDELYFELLMAHRDPQKLAQALTNLCVEQFPRMSVESMKAWMYILSCFNSPSDTFEMLRRQRKLTEISSKLDHSREYHRALYLDEERDLLASDNAELLVDALFVNPPQPDVGQQEQGQAAAAVGLAEVGLFVERLEDQSDDEGLGEELDQGAQFAN